MTGLHFIWNIIARLAIIGRQSLKPIWLKSDYSLIFCKKLLVWKLENHRRPLFVYSLIHHFFFSIYKSIQCEYNYCHPCFVLLISSFEHVTSYRTNTVSLPPSFYLYWFIISHYPLLECFLNFFLQAYKMILLFRTKSVHVKMALLPPQTSSSTQKVTIGITLTIAANVAVHTWP